MASGEVGSTVAFVFPETYRPVPVDCRHMSVECPFGLIWMSKPSLPVISRNISAVIFSPLRISACSRQAVVAISLLSPFFPALLFFPFQPLFFLPFCIFLTGLYQGVESRPSALNTWTDKRGMIFPSSTSFRVFSIQFLQ